MSENIEKIKSVIHSDREEKPDLIINRLPDNTKRQFLEFAHAEFCGDYGFTFKHLIDFYFGLIPKGTEHLEIEIEGLKGEVQTLKQVISEIQQQPEASIKLASGKVINKVR